MIKVTAQVDETGTNVRMRTPEEKEKLILEFMSSNTSRKLFCKEKNINRRLFTIWCCKYEKDGIEGLTSQTGRKNGTNKGRPKKAETREEKLERENLKLRIEIERLKKGYYVKGVGRRKEYVSINNKSIKSSEN